MDIKGKIVSGLSSLKDNKPRLIGVIIVGIILLLALLYRMYKNIEAKELAEPLIIRNVLSMAAPDSNTALVYYPSDKMAYPENGNGFTFSTWLFVNDVVGIKGKGHDKYKHLFHYGMLDMSLMAPGIFLITNSNTLAICVDNGARKNNVTTSPNHDTTIEELTGTSPDNQNITKFKVDAPCGCEKLLKENPQYNTACFVPLKNTDESNTCVLSTKKYIDNVPRVTKDGYITYIKNNDSDKFGMDPYSTSGNIFSQDDSCVIVENIPLQRWFNLVIVMNNVTVEIYVDGKLYKTLVLHGSVKFVNPSDQCGIYAGYKGGFDGFMNELRYFPYPLKYFDVYNIYTRGPTPFYFSKVFGRKVEIFDKYMNEYKRISKELATDATDMLDETSAFFLGEADLSGTTLEGLRGASY